MYQELQCTRSAIVLFVRPFVLRLVFRVSPCVLGPVHTYPDIFESATFPFRIQKFPRPHVSDGIRIHSSTQGSSALKCVQSMRRRARQWREICSVRPPRCAWTRFLRHRIKNIRIHPSTLYRIRCGYIFFHFGPVHTLSDQLRIYFFPLWRADLFFSGFAVEFSGYVWTVAVSGKKKLRIRKYPDTCGRGLSRLCDQTTDFCFWRGCVLSSDDAQNILASVSSDVFSAVSQAK